MRPAGKTVVAVVEDDGPLRALLLDFLALRGYDARGAATGTEGVALVTRLRPSLVILDVMMPDLDGLSVCRILKADRRTRGIPVLILTSHATTETRLKALEFAADHFLAKPILDLEEFGRWVAALLARSPSSVPGQTVVGGVLTLDAEESTVSIQGGAPRPLPPKLFTLLCELARRSGEPLSREYLVDRLWSNAVKDREVDVVVSRLRQALGPGGDAAIVAVPGRGYRLDVAALLQPKK
ncbi:MAG: response regulator transcription factor [Elusimicrobia bacterium]|nr:response regulator transcription factor [Elusimicrobiota bacterium]